MALRAKCGVSSKRIVTEEVTEKVSKFKYLRYEMSILYAQEHTNYNLKIFQYIFETIIRTQEHKIRVDTQLKFYELLSQMYGCETWTLRRIDERRLEAAVLMQSLRWVAGCTLRNQVITGNEEAGQINTMEAEQLAKTFAEDAIRKSSEPTFR